LLYPAGSTIIGRILALAMECCVMDKWALLKDRIKQAAPIIGVVLALLPIIQIGVYLRGYLVNLPWWDEYDVSVIIAEKTATGTLTPHDLLLQQNEHIIVFTNLITAFSTHFLHWYVPLGSWISFGLAIINLAILMDLFRRDCPQAFPIAAPLFSLLSFSVRQIINWQLAFQSEWFFVIMWLLLALWVLKTRPQSWPPVIAAAALALLATFTFTLGLLLWGLLPAAFGLMGYRRRRYYVFWVVAAVVGCGAYSIVHVPNLPQITFDPILLTSYSLIVLGSPMTWADAATAILLAVFAAAILVANLIYLRHRLPLARLAVWITLALFALAAAFTNAIAGALIWQNVYPVQPFLSRYVSVSLLLWIAAIATILMSFVSLAQQEQAGSGEGFLRRTDILFLGVMLSAHLLINLFFYQFPGLAPPLVTRQQAECVRAYPQTRDDSCLTGLHAHIAIARTGVLILAKYHLSLFSDQP
jgi:hypothetical protein